MSELHSDAIAHSQGAAEFNRQHAPPCKSSSGVKVRRIDQWDTLQELSAEWSRLLSESSSGNFFQTWEWTSSWWKAYGLPLQLFVLVCHDADGSLLGIAPLYRGPSDKDFPLSVRVLRLIGDGSDDADGFDFIIKDGFEEVCIDGFLRWLNENRTEWDLLELNSVPGESTNAEALLGQMQHWGWPHRVSWTPHMVISLPSSWAEYQRQVSAKVRQTWTRKINRAEREFEYRLQYCRNKEEISADLDSTFELHQKSWTARGKTGKFDTAERRDFYRTLTEQANQRGWLDLWLLRVNDSAVAARFGIRYGNTRYALLAGFDPEYSKYAVGTIIEALLIKELIGQGVQFYDFLAGQDAYKLEFGPQRRRYLNIRCARPRTRAGLVLFTAKSLERSKDWLRTHLPASSWKLLRKISHVGRGPVPGEQK